jgi:LytS/YehU family sensor histidine kinase
MAGYKLSSFVLINLILVNGLPQIMLHTKWFKKTLTWEEDFKMKLVLYITFSLFTATQNFFLSSNKKIVSLSRSPPLKQEFVGLHFALT